MSDVAENQVQSEASLREQIVAAIKEIYDPEIPVNIYEMGLIYEVAINDRDADITMTLTTPNCPSAQFLPSEVKRKAEEVDGIDMATVDVVWDPPWNMDMMSEEAKLTLGFI